jgi:hypothetical protein
MAGDGELAEATRTLFRMTIRKLGMTGKPPPLSTDNFRRPGEHPQLF